jgi:Fe-S cluster assembly protein SufD
MEKKPMINNFKYNKDTLHKLLDNRQEANWMTQYRLETLKKFENIPWPTTKDEEWRRTNISHIDFGKYNLHRDYEKEMNIEHPDSLPKLSGQIKFEGFELVEKKLDNSLNQKGVIYTTLSDATIRYPELVQKYFTKNRIEKFQTLNQSFWTHGIFLYVPESVIISQPFLTVFEESTTGGASFPHNIIILEKGAQITFHQKNQSGSEEAVFQNAVVNITVNEAATLNYFEMQRLNQKSINFSNSKTLVARDANFNSLIVNLGSQLTKTKFESVLNESGANVKLNGLYYANEQQHFDLRTEQNHLASHANSFLLYKGVVRDRAHTIYQGLIKVHKAAQQTDAYQSNKNLVLNDKARADSIPSLEIEANDVKCSHGSTVGRVNESEIFYLMSRGISYDEAKKMIISGFFEDVLAGATNDIKESLRKEIEKGLHSDLNN